MAGRPTQHRETTAGRTGLRVSLEDAALIKRVKAGETEAYGTLVRKYQDRVFNTCWRICGHLEDARDLTQEAFLKALENLSGFRRQSGFYTWLFRIAVNLTLTHRKTMERRRTVSLDDGTDVAGTQAEGLAKRIASGSKDNPLRRVTEAELQGCVARALLELDDDQRTVVVLRDIEGLDYREIAEVLEIPPGTVKSRLHRARTALYQAVRPAVTRS